MRQTSMNSFWRHIRWTSGMLLACLITMGIARAQAPFQKTPFEVDGRRAFVADAPNHAAGKPWVWYAPTLGENLPGKGHEWYVERFHKAGISLAGIDLGEVRGSSASNEKFLRFHEEMVRKGYSPKPILLGQSRGGLMMLSFAAKHPDKVAAWVGIYPVCNLKSWPWKNSKSATLSDYGLNEEEFLSKIDTFNPVEQLKGLVSNRVPFFAVHGDVDTVVPIEENSGLLQDRLTKLGWTMTLKVIPNEGHKVSPSFFECQELVDFVFNVDSNGGR